MFVSHHQYSILQLSFQEWTQQVQEMLNTKKFGDVAFRDKDFKSSVDHYTKVSRYMDMTCYFSFLTKENVLFRLMNSAFTQLVTLMAVPTATVFARRAFSYLMIGLAELALRDAMQAQVCMPEWPTAFYLQALALSKLGMEANAQDMLNDGAAFEVKKQR